MLFHNLSDNERRLIRAVWRWDNDGRLPAAMPTLTPKQLDTLIAKLWYLYSRYRTEVLHIEMIIDDVETIEDSEGVEESESEKENLDSCIEKLREIIRILEWLRANQRGKPEQ